MEPMEEQGVSLKSHRKTGSGVSISSREGAFRISLTNVSGAEESIPRDDQHKDDLLRKMNSKQEFRLNLDKKLSASQSTTERFSLGDILEKSPTNTLVKRSQTLRTIPSLTSIRSNTSCTSIDELDTAYATLAQEETMLPEYHQIKQALKKNTEMNSKS